MEQVSWNTFVILVISCALRSLPLVPPPLLACLFLLASVLASLPPLLTNLSWYSRQTSIHLFYSYGHTDLQVLTTTTIRYYQMTHNHPEQLLLCRYLIDKNPFFYFFPIIYILITDNVLHWNRNIFSGGEYYVRATIVTCINYPINKSGSFGHKIKVDWPQVGSKHRRTFYVTDTTSPSVKQNILCMGLTFGKPK